MGGFNGQLTMMAISGQKSYKTGQLRNQLHKVIRLTTLLT